jgi:hypothetical protein
MQTDVTVEALDQGESPCPPVIKPVLNTGNANNLQYYMSFC